MLDIPAVLHSLNLPQPWSSGVCLLSETYRGSKALHIKFTALVCSLEVKSCTTTSTIFFLNMCNCTGFYPSQCMFLKSIYVN